MSHVSSFGSVGFVLVCVHLLTWASHIMLPFPNTTLVYQTEQQLHRLDHGKAGTNRVYADPDSTKDSAGSVIRRLRKVTQGEIPTISDYHDQSYLQIQIYPTIQQLCVTSAKPVKAIPTNSLLHPGLPSPLPFPWE